MSYVRPLLPPFSYSFTNYPLPDRPPYNLQHRYSHHDPPPLYHRHPRLLALQQKLHLGSSKPNGLLDTNLPNLRRANLLRPHLRNILHSPALQNHRYRYGRAGFRFYRNVGRDAVYAEFRPGELEG